jgi:hypothetical protein
MYYTKAGVGLCPIVAAPVTRERIFRAVINVRLLLHKHDSRRTFV